MGGHAMDTGRPKEEGWPLDEDTEDFGLVNFLPLNEDENSSRQGRAINEQ
jgi:hypothetical protein